MSELRLSPTNKNSVMKKKKETRCDGFVVKIDPNFQTLAVTNYQKRKEEWDEYLVTRR